MTDGSLPGITRGRPRGRRRVPRPGQWLGVTVVAAGMAAATVLVPPLIAPDKDSGATGSATPSAPPTQGPPSSPVPLGSGKAPGSPAPFTPVVVEAEAPGNRLTGGAGVTACVTCHGGARVRYLCFTCTLEVRAVLPVAGSRTVTVGYEVDGPRSVKVAVNGAPARTFQVTGSEWTTPRSFQFTAELPAGDLRLTFFNDDTPAPDIDVVTIS
ncbi:hypothetical protein AB0K00_08195 [Dactylosporangium sp. NPDC049525]|uniref:hypothetical protein n=1 Tax=Dactylosporangium sp. NPDC049525 TaxID=3154730 RepID=UPI00341C1B79